MLWTLKRKKRNVEDITRSKNGKRKLKERFWHLLLFFVFNVLDTSSKKSKKSMFKMLSPQIDTNFREALIRDDI